MEKILNLYQQLHKYTIDIKNSVMHETYNELNELILARENVMCQIDALKKTNNFVLTDDVKFLLEDIIAMNEDVEKLMQAGLNKVKDSIRNVKQQTNGNRYGTTRKALNGYFVDKYK